MKDAIARRVLAAVAAACLAVPGCISLAWQDPFHADGDSDHFKYVATRIEYTDVDSAPTIEHASTAAPRSLDGGAPTEYWDVTLEEVVRFALDNSRVMRDLGGILVRTPSAVPTTFDPGIQETDPQVGVAAALSAFDASFASSAFFEYNDRALNNTFFGGGTRNLKQDLAILQTQIAKRAVTGTELVIRNNTDYDANNSPGNAFPSVWNTNIEAEIRHPLLLGGGVDFNRITGGSGLPGVNNGVLIARLNTDMSLSDFEIAVRDFISNVENAYWDLFFAYRDLEAKIKARDSALRTWQVIKALEGRRGGEAAKETQAREQYYRFKEEVQNALNGQLLQGTETNNGSRGGTFRGNLGVYFAERRLRLMMGLPITDYRLLRPAEKTPLAEILFDWDEALLEALMRRAELRKQKWLVKRRELDLAASRRYLLPTLDAIGRYRWRGFGKDLFRQHNLNAADIADTTRKRSEANNAFDSLINGDYQEWQLGVELSFPFGYRQAHAAVRNAELRLARARTVLNEQEREVIFGLSNAVSEMKRAYAVLDTNFRRRLAAQQQVVAVHDAYERDEATIDVLLEAQRRLAAADSAYYRSVAQYAMSIKNVHFEKGSLLEFNEIALAEGLWPVKAYWDAKQRHQLGWQPPKWLVNPLLSARPVVSEGEFPQTVLPADQPPVGAPDGEYDGYDGESLDGQDWENGEMVAPPAPPVDASGFDPDANIPQPPNDVYIPEPPKPDESDGGESDRDPNTAAAPPLPLPDRDPVSPRTTDRTNVRSLPSDATPAIDPVSFQEPAGASKRIGVWSRTGRTDFQVGSESPSPTTPNPVVEENSPPFLPPSAFRKAALPVGQRLNDRSTPQGDDNPFLTPAELKQLSGSASP